MTQKLYAANEVIAWYSGFSVDGDGAPTCYAPKDSGLPALDDLCCAGEPNNWWGLACDPHGTPYVQTASDPAPGYYISTTALVDRSKHVYDPSRYVNADENPYIVIPPELLHKGCRLGDVGIVLHKGHMCPAIVADIGPTNHYGEGSIELARNLGIPCSPKDGGVKEGVLWIVWTKSAQKPQKWPLSWADWCALVYPRFDVLNLKEIRNYLGIAT